MTKTDDTTYLLNFANRIPQYECKCRQIWIKENPPTFGEKYFEWTVKTHNAVNKKLGKTELTLEQARILY